MGNSVNFGSQVVLWNYGTEYKSLTFGKLLDSMNIEGILEGLTVARTSDTSITIAIGSVIIKNEATLYATEPVTSKIHFTQPILLTITSAVTRIALRYEYDNDAVSYASVVLTVDSAPATNDIVLCDITWNTGIIKSISYFSANYSVLKNLDKRVNKIKFAIDNGGTYNDTIKLVEDAHLIYNDNGYWSYALIDSSNVSIQIDPTTIARVDLVYYDTLDSSLKVIDSSSITLTTTSIPLLLINRGADRDDITIDDFIYIN